MTSIWWIRRDLRLRDQPALHAAMQAGAVVPLFILDPQLLAKSLAGIPKRRQAFLFAGLRALDSELQGRGATLIVRSGAPIDVLRGLTQEVRADAIFAEEDYTPYARRRDGLVGKALDLRLVPGQLVQSPASLTKSGGSPYVVYTPYARAWKRMLPERLTTLAAPEHIEMPRYIPSEQIPQLSAPEGFVAGEAEAHRRLASFLQERIYSYGRDRDRPGVDGTSSLSPYLRFGMLSMKQAANAALEALGTAGDETAQASAETWLNELIWREFYVQIMYHFPRVHGSAFRPEFAQIPWRNSHAEFEAWKAGMTGVPIVDAAMRQLAQTGWMHNRARMIAASYLVKDLLIDWRWGEAWFMSQLIDGDPASNNGGWQWTAGTGTDAAPYFRIFNPVLQSRRFDPDGAYIRRWVPELAGVPDGSIHAPWDKGLEIRGYPSRPIVDHREAIKRTRLAYETARDAAANEGRK